MSKDIVIENINTPTAFGVALKRLRKNSGVSQDQLAHLLNMRQATISDIENGRGTLESLFKVIQALKINLVLSNSSFTKDKDHKSKARKILDLLND
ncbi:MAG: transcriptional regulator [Bdellovibrio sp. CG12_big_fil_rev_8_21_14_0_65_39_13]|nr:MAG: transcriptional regulator [Bdellovibrio sp. CG22_combo_CG10-13_8_21_14_all_39_27]PIQ59565.1 MAG: transcriptional regulator [Bdellovibrio sp. CG12_big_fil_rev_8_21_14_0_65_39_13]PIR33199.1 MAG: transcriptional regulator [Bdellovibrio sp. CG11_big_fil_rev_8_21_14_0_20_39_38]